MRCLLSRLHHHSTRALDPIVLAGAALLTVVSTTAPAVADMLVRPPVVAPLANAQQRAALAADHRGRILILGGQTGAMTVATSSDDGRNWTPPVTLESTPGRYGGAALCVDRFGRGFAAWRFAASGSAPGEIHGASFRFTEAATNTIPPLSVFRLDKGFDLSDSGEPELDCNEEGVTLVAWEEQTHPSGGHDLLGALVDVSDRSVARLLKLSAPGAEDNAAPDPDMRADGIGYVVFQARFPNRSDIYLATVDPGLAGTTVTKIPTDGPVVPPIIPHNEIRPQIAHQGGRAPAAAAATGEMVVVWLDDRGGFFRTLATFSTDGGRSWYSEANLPTTPDGGVCQVTQSMARVCRGGAGVVVGFECTDPTASNNIAFTNSSRNLGQTWESSPAQPLDDEGSTGLQAFDLQCVEGRSLDAHAALRVSPREGRQYHVGARGPAGGFAFTKHTEPADGLPQDHGDFVSLAHDEGQAWIAIDLVLQGELAVNGTTGETRLNTECPSGVCHTESPTIAFGDPPFLHAAWVSRGATAMREIRAATSPDGGGHWVPAGSPVAAGNVMSPFLLATEGPDTLSVSPVMALYLDFSGTGASAGLQSSLSVDHGSSWIGSGQVNTTPLAGTVLVSGMGAVLNGRSRFYAAWIDDTGQNGQVRFSVFTQSGWSADVRLDTPPGPLAGHAVGRPRVGCDDQGNVCVFWEDHRNPNDSQIRVNCSNDGGATFQLADTPLDAPNGLNSTDLDIATDGHGHYAVVWKEPTPTGLGDAIVTRHACRVGGPNPAANWSPPLNVPAGPPGAPIHSPQITLEAKGHEIVAWDNGGRVFANVSKDWGNSFGASASPLAVCAAPGAPSPDCGDGVRLLATPDGGAALAFEQADAGGLGVSTLTADDFGSGANWQGPFLLTPDGANGFEPDTGGAGAREVHQELHRPPTAMVTAWPTTGNAIAEPDIAVNRWRIPDGVPLEMKTVRAGTTGRFTWEPFDFPSGAAASYDAYRGTLPPLPSTTPWQCLASHLPGAELSDPAVPPPGGILAYIITGVGPGGEGPAGTIIPLSSCEPAPPACF